MDSAKYARHIGRVGALAVALGVGAAVASGYGTGVAWADDTGGGDQGSVSADRGFDYRGMPAGSFEGYAVFDLQATVAFESGTLGLGIENLFDRKYITYFSQTTPADDDYNAGRGRTLSASWRWRF